MRGLWCIRPLFMQRHGWPVGIMSENLAEFVDLPRTAYLDHTLRRARTAAEQRSHRYVTVEHLLLALLDDPDALNLLGALGTDIAGIKMAISDAVNHRMSALAVPDGRPPVFSYKFDSLFAVASQDAMCCGRMEVDGAFATIAVAKDQETNAAGILSANGFHLQAALQMLGAPAPNAPHAQQPQPLTSKAPFEYHLGEAIALPERVPENRPLQTPPPSLVIAPAHADISPGLRGEPAPLAGAASNPVSAETLKDNMLAQVRAIVDDEEARQRGFYSAPVEALPERGGQTRSEPQLRAPPEESRAVHGRPGAARLQSAPQPKVQGLEQVQRVEPSLGGPARAPLTRQPAAGQALVYGEPSAVSLHAGSQPQKGEGRRVVQEARPARRKGEARGPLGPMHEAIPKRVRRGALETIEILLTKDEATSLLAKVPRRGQAQSLAALPTCRAVTLRLSAPEGGFIVEAMAPETQWILDRPSFVGEDQFGTWGWVVLPNETGTFILKLSMSARDVDANGVLGELQVPEHTVKVRVRGDLWGGLWAFIRSLLLILLGSGLTVGVYYVLKLMGKLGH
jgi:neural Wiskott-Aldrich syndrome protein